MKWWIFMIFAISISHCGGILWFFGIVRVESPNDMLLAPKDLSKFWGEHEYTNLFRNNYWMLHHASGAGLLCEQLPGTQWPEKHCWFNQSWQPSGCIIIGNDAVRLSAGQTWCLGRGESIPLWGDVWWGSIWHLSCYVLLHCPGQKAKRDLRWQHQLLLGRWCLRIAGFQLST